MIWLGLLLVGLLGIWFARGYQRWRETRAMRLRERQLQRWNMKPPQR